jgi:3-oxoacyl-[acyl-carrier protein] reductase
MNLKHRTIVITGGTSGIGLATAQHAHAQGANILVYSHSNPDQADKTFFSDPTVLFVKGDIRDRKKVVSAYQQALKKFGSLDILINNAAIAQKKPFISTTQKDWDDLIDINIKGTLVMTQEFLIHFTGQEGMIINISSGAGLYGIEGMSIYSLTKAALINLTQSLVQELQKENIAVITVTPGSTNTNMFNSVFPDRQAHHTPDHVANVIIDTITGAITPNDALVVDVFKHTR